MGYINREGNTSYTLYVEKVDSKEDKIFTLDSYKYIYCTYYSESNDKGVKLQCTNINYTGEVNKEKIVTLNDDLFTYKNTWLNSTTGVGQSSPDSSATEFISLNDNNSYEYISSDNNTSLYLYDINKNFIKIINRTSGEILSKDSKYVRFGSNSTDVVNSDATLNKLTAVVSS